MWVGNYSKKFGCKVEEIGTKWEGVCTIKNWVCSNDSGNRSVKKNQLSKFEDSTGFIERFVNQATSHVSSRER